MKIFITGVDGFIGHSLTHRILTTTDWQVVGLDLFGNRVQPLLKYPQFHFRQADLTTCQDWVDAQIRDCDVVLPLAACALPSQYIKDPIGIFQLDFEENLRIIRICFEQGKRVIFPSTSEVYGMCEDELLNEENSPLVFGPINKERWIYACSKQMLDRVIWAYGSQGLQFTLFRPFNWFGPNLDNIHTAKKGGARVVTQFLGHLLRGEPLSLVDGGKQQRCFTHIDDGVDALMRILHNQKGAANQRIFNIGNPNNGFSICELAHLMAETLAEFPGWSHIRHTKDIRVESAKQYYGQGYQDVQLRKPDITLAQTLLGWQPTVTMDEGLKQTIAYYLENDFKPVTPIQSKTTVSSMQPVG
jgi:nucleoside-diphosphate-sugar epimerase